MTGPIATARAELTAILRAATTVDVHDTIPRQILGPCVMLAERTPLIEWDSQAPRTYWVRLDAIAVTRPSNHPAAVAELDALTDQIVTGTLDLHPEVTYNTFTAADGQTYLVAALSYQLGPYTICQE